MTWISAVDARELEASLMSSRAFADNAASLTYEEVGYEMSLQANVRELHLSDGSVLWSRVKKEFKLLVCGSDKKYADLRKQLHRQSGQVTITIVSLISSTLGNVIGATAAVISPIISLLLLATVRIGVAALREGPDIDQPIRSA